MDVVDDLAQALFALGAPSEATAATTARITREIASWAHRRGWTTRTEGRIGVTTGALNGKPRRGFVDVVVRRAPAGPDLAIEIDSANKPWSADKLRHAIAGGMRGVWVRWGDEDWATAYGGIDVIQLPIQRRAATVTVAAQLELWERRRAASAAGPRAGRRSVGG